MFDPEQRHDPEFLTRVQATHALITERVRRGDATPAEQLAVAVLDEMSDEDDPDAVRAWAPSAAFREAVPRDRARHPRPLRRHRRDARRRPRHGSAPPASSTTTRWPPSSSAA